MANFHIMTANGKKYQYMKEHNYLNNWIRIKVFSFQVMIYLEYLIILLLLMVLIF